MKPPYIIATLKWRKQRRADANLWQFIQVRTKSQTKWGFNGTFKRYRNTSWGKTTDWKLIRKIIGIRLSTRLFVAIDYDKIIRILLLKSMQLHTKFLVWGWDWRWDLKVLMLWKELNDDILNPHKSNYLKMRLKSNAKTRGLIDSFKFFWRDFIRWWGHLYKTKSSC